MDRGAPRLLLPPAIASHASAGARRITALQMGRFLLRLEKQRGKRGRKKRKRERLILPNLRSRTSRRFPLASLGLVSFRSPSLCIDPLLVYAVAQTNREKRHGNGTRFARWRSRESTKQSVVEEEEEQKPFGLETHLFLSLSLSTKTQPKPTTASATAPMTRAASTASGGTPATASAREGSRRRGWFFCSSSFLSFFPSFAFLCSPFLSI